MGIVYERCKALRRENYEIAKGSMGKASGGDADGSARRDGKMVYVG